MKEKHMPNDINNQDTVSGRIEKALLFTELLSRYRELFDQNEPLETVITDVFTDLLHIAATADPDCVDDVLSKARMHLDGERLESSDSGGGPVVESEVTGSEYEVWFKDYQSRYTEYRKARARRSNCYPDGDVHDDDDDVWDWADIEDTASGLLDELASQVGIK